MLCRILKTALEGAHTFEVAPGCAPRAGFLEAARAERPDVLVVGFDGDALPPGCSQLLAERTDMVVLAVTGDGRRAGLLDEASGPAIVEAIRLAARP
jgi:hypothetical protein